MAIDIATARTEIAKLYIAAFNRVPDSAGLDFWVDSYVNKGQTLNQIAQNFTNSTEYKAKYPAYQTNAEFVEAIYQNVFGRASDAEGKAYWEARLVSTGADSLTHGTLMQAMVDAAMSNGSTDGQKLTNQATFAVNAVLNNIDNASATAQLANVTSDAASITTATTAATTASQTAAGQTYTLTAGVDTITGTTGNDTITANYDAVNTSKTLTALDSINGGAGTDTLNVTETVATSIPATATVTNVEVANLTSSTTVDGSTAGWTGLTTLNVSEFGGQASGLTAAATTDINVTEKNLAGANVIVDGGKNVSVTVADTTGAGAVGVGATTAAAGTVSVTSAITNNTTGAAITVTGGTTITTTQTTTASTNTGHINKSGAVIVNGNASTTTVSATATKAAAATATAGAIANSTVYVTDVNYGTTTAGTITNVTANGYTTLNVDASSLSTLSVANGSGNITIDNSDAVTAPVTTLNMTVNGLTGGTLDDADVYSTLNVTTTGANSTLANITDTAARTLNVSGDKALTLTTAAGMTGLTTITVAGSAGLTSNAAAGLGAVTTVTSTSTGATSVTVDATAVTVTGAAGTETITYEAAIGATANVNLGAGDDKLVITAATTAGATINAGEGRDTLQTDTGADITNVGYSNFDVIRAANGTGTYNMAFLSGVDEIEVTADTVAALVFSNVVAGTTLNFLAEGADDLTTHGVTYTLADATGLTDSVSVKLAGTDGNDDGTADGEFTIGNTTNGLVLAGIETINFEATMSELDVDDVTTAGTDESTVASDYTHVVTELTANAVKTINVTGASNLTITDITATTLTKVDASAMTGSLNINLDNSATATVTVLGGSAADTITMTNNTALNNLIVGNGGADIITLAASGTREVVRIASDTDSVLTLTDTTTPAVTPVVMDTATGYDKITNFTSGEDKLELSAALGLGTGDARSAIAGKGILAADGSADSAAEIAATLQTLIGTGLDFFNDGAADRAVAAVSYNDTTASEDFVMLFIDTNNDGNFTNGTDQAIMLSGITATPLITDIVFG